MTPSPRKISREKGVDVCIDLLLSGRKAGEIIRECGEKYGVKRSAVEKWMQLARPKVELLRREMEEKKKVELEKSIIEGAQRLGITREGVMERLWRIANGNLQDFFQGRNTVCPMKDLPRETAALLHSIEVDELYHGSGDTKYWAGQTKKIRLHDPLRAIDMINKMQGWYTDTGAPAVTNVFIGYGKEVPV